jgi:DNA (cytosine-5)-methyltransferase 1
VQRAFLRSPQWNEATLLSLPAPWCWRSDRRRAAMRALGYALSPHVLDAADYGVPQNRPRLVVIATRSKAPFALRMRSGAHRPIEPHIQWDRGPWRVIDRSLAPATQLRIKNGRRAFGERFVAHYYSSGSGLTGRSIDRPIGTITTRARWSVIDGNRMRRLNVDESRAAMGFRPSYQLPKNKNLAKHMLGNAVPPPMVTKIINELEG